MGGWTDTDLGVDGKSANIYITQSKARGRLRDGKRRVTGIQCEKILKDTDRSSLTFFRRVLKKFPSHKLKLKRLKLVGAVVKSVCVCVSVCLGMSLAAC